MCDLRDIERLCQAYVGGLQEIYIIVPLDVSSIQTQYCTPNLTEDVELEEGKRAYVMKFSKGTGTFIERSIIDNRAGDYFQQTISYFLPKDRVEVADLKQKVKNRRFHLIYKDGNNQRKVLQNLRIQTETNTGDKKTARNGASFTCTARSTKPAPFLLGEISNEVPVEGELILIAPNGQRYRITVDTCGALVTVPISDETGGLDSIMIDDHTMYVDEDGALETEE